MPLEDPNRMCVAELGARQVSHSHGLLHGAVFPRGSTYNADMPTVAVHERFKRETMRVVLLDRARM